MKVGEILRKIADLVDQGESKQSTSPNQAVLTPAEHETEENPDVNTQSMVNPLQQKLELLKKSVGVDNAFDAGDIGCDEPGNDELSILKRNAGVPVVTVQTAGEDNDLEA